MTEEEKHLVIRRGRVDSVDLYEVKEHELDLLEKGSPASLQLNFSIFLLSTAITCIVSLMTSTCDSPVTELVFIAVSVMGILLGLFLMLSWWRNRSSVSGVVTRIRGRIADGGSTTRAPSPVQDKKPDDDEQPYG